MSRAPFPLEAPKSLAAYPFGHCILWGCLQLLPPLEVSFRHRLPLTLCFRPRGASPGSKGQSLLAVVTRSSESASCIM